MLRFLRRALDFVRGGPQTLGVEAPVTPDASRTANEPRPGSNVSDAGVSVPAEIADLTDLDLESLTPPEDLHDIGGWNRYWQIRLEHRTVLAMEEGLDAAFCRAQRQRLVDVMVANNLHSVLCVGGGLAGESHALAAAGFAVTVLDLSSLAVEFGPKAQFPPEGVAHYLGRPCGRPGGTLEFVVGDLFDPQASPGPFDVVIERRTVQLCLGHRAEFERALDAVTARLRVRGVFVSHFHSGRWRPGEPRQHPAKEWLLRRGFTVLPSHPEGFGEHYLSGREAWLLFTSG